MKSLGDRLENFSKGDLFSQFSTTDTRTLIEGAMQESSATSQDLSASAASLDALIAKFELPPAKRG